MWVCINLPVVGATGYSATSLKQPCPFCLQSGGGLCYNLAHAFAIRRRRMFLLGSEFCWWAASWDCIVNLPVCSVCLGFVTNCSTTSCKWWHMCLQKEQEAVYRARRVPHSWCAFCECMSVSLYCLFCLSVPLTAVQHHASGHTWSRRVSVKAQKVSLVAMYHASVSPLWLSPLVCPLLFVHATDRHWVLPKMIMPFGAKGRMAMFYKPWKVPVVGIHHVSVLQHSQCDWLFCCLVCDWLLLPGPQCLTVFKWACLHHVS